MGCTLTAKRRGGISIYVEEPLADFLDTVGKLLDLTSVQNVKYPGDAGKKGEKTLFLLSAYCTSARQTYGFSSFCMHGEK